MTRSSPGPTLARTPRSRSRKRADEIRFLLMILALIGSGIAMGLAPSLWARL